MNKLRKTQFAVLNGFYAQKYTCYNIILYTQFKLGQRDNVIMWPIEFSNTADYWTVNTCLNFTWFNIIVSFL